VAFTPGTRRTNIADFYQGQYRGTVTLSTSEATGSGTTSIVVGNGYTATWYYLPVGTNSFGEGSYGTNDHASTTFNSGQLFVIKISGPGGCIDRYWLNVVVGSGSSSPTLSAAQIAANAAAAAKAAAEAAAAARAAEVAIAQTKLSTVLRSDKAATSDEYKSAGVNVTSAASLARINVEVLKLSANDRSDMAKIRAIADKIEFDESFFNANARPTLSTFTKYEVVGITERILPTVNAKILELPAAFRVDAKAIQDLVKVESFVDRVANTETRSTVSASALVEKGLLPSTSPYKYSVVQGLAKYPEGSLNTMAKIEAAIKEQIAKAEAPKLRLAAIKAKIAARKK
jgi:hypothetical protein